MKEEQWSAIKIALPRPVSLQEWTELVTKIENALTADLHYREGDLAYSPLDKSIRGDRTHRSMIAPGNWATCTCDVGEDHRMTYRIHEIPRWA